MVKTFFQVEKMERKARIIEWIAILIAWILMVLIVTIAFFAFVKNPAEQEMITVGTFIALLIILMGRYITFQGFGRQYILAVRMGRKKSSFLISHLILEFIFISISMVVTYLLYKLELHLYRQLGIVNFEFTLDGFFDLRVTTCLVILLSVLNMFFGAIYLWKVWIPSAFWCVICLSMGRAGSWIEGIKTDSGIVHQIGTVLNKIPAYGGMLIVLGIAGIMVFISKKILYSRNL